MLKVEAFPGMPVTATKLLPLLDNPDSTASDIESIYQFLFKKFNLHCKYGGFEGLEVSLNELADQKHKYLKYKKRAEELGANVFLYPEELNYLEVQN